IIAEKIYSKGIFEEALKIARNIKNLYFKSRILINLAEKSLSACKIVIPIIKKGRLNFIINKIVKSNKFEDILKMIKDNKDPYLKSYALTIIGENISSNNLFIDALNFAYKIEVLDKKLEILSFIAEKSYSQQVLKIILNKIHEIDNPYYQSEILCLIGEKTSNSELINEALNVTYRIENSLEKSKILSFIATSKNLNLEIFTKLIKIGMITSIHTLMIIIIESIHFWNRFNLSFNQILPIFLRLINNK
ncbi:MAG: hypothetical protein HWN67_09595, partial [Candidatus Helarchaeota archaeon]|nr:hypothetical protein [Candidatus Helarchaeota archaeon]